MSEIVLIRPPIVLSKYTVTASATPPIAIAYLSGTLRANGYDLQTIDAIGEDIDRMTAIELMKEHHPALYAQHQVNQRTKFGQA